MNKTILKEIASEQAMNFKSKKNIIQRALPENFIKNKKISIISGVRRSGKSTLLKQISVNFKSFHYFNFEDERLLAFDKNDFNPLLEVLMEINGEQKVIFFDEIQYIIGWEKFVSRLFSLDYKIFITGSSANLLSKELGTALTGRHIKLELYPFSFKEFLKYHNYNDYNLDLTTNRAKLKRFFKQYLEIGGLPEVMISQDRSELKQLYQDLLIKDIILRFKIRETKSFRELALYLISNISSPLSFNRLKTILDFKSVSTVKNYVEYLEEAYLIFSVFRYDFSVKKQLVANRKIYGIDLAMINEVAFSFSQNKGQNLENLVYLELKRLNYSIYYYQEKLECDFLVYYKGKIIQAIQVVDKLTVNNKKREVAGLLAAMEKHKLTEGFILTNDYSGIENIEGKKIICEPVWRWLLKKI